MNAYPTFGVALLLVGGFGPPADARRDLSEHSGDREPILLLQGADLVLPELFEIPRTQEQRQHHDEEPRGRDPERDREEHQQDEADEERERREADPARQMRRERGSPDLFDQAGVVFGEAALDLVEDALLVI